MSGEKQVPSPGRGTARWAGAPALGAGALGKTLPADLRLAGLGLPGDGALGTWAGAAGPVMAEAEEGVAASHQRCPAEPTRALGSGWRHTVP